MKTGNESEEEQEEGEKLEERAAQTQLQDAQAKFSWIFQRVSWVGRKGDVQQVL